MNNSIFLLHPSHAGYLDGSSRKLSGVGNGLLIVTIVIGIICAAVGIGLAAYPANEYAVRDALAKNGVMTLATITDKRINESRIRSYNFTYRYDAEVNGQVESFTREELVGDDLYFSADRGDRLSLHFLPDNPQTARLDDQSFNGVMYVALGIVFVVLGIIIIFNYVRQYRRDRMLERGGQVITGSIVKSWTKGWGNKRELHIQYEFPSPGAMTLTGKQSAPRPDIEAADVPPGTKVAVVYHDDKTYRVL